jgi:hypothetical protein
MAIPSIYINLEDDVTKIVTRLKHTLAKQVVLVCPKRSYIFSDSINLRLLKKQVDLLGKEVFILTMDEKGQLYAREAGFALKFLPKSNGSVNFSDVKFSQKPVDGEHSPEAEQQNQEPVKKIKHVVKAVKKSAIENQALAAPVLGSLVKEHFPKVEVTDTFFPTSEPEYKQQKSAKPHLNRAITGIAAFSLILLLLLAFVILPKATVAVFPKTEPVTRDMEINFSTNAQSVDPTKLIMPAQLINQTVNLSDKFQSQGKLQVGNKAQGTIQIYNFTHAPINLKAGTTILTVGNKNYNLVNDVSGLKPTTYINSRTKEVNPASLGDPVDVIAAQGGEDYNLPAGSRMEITNQVFGSRPQLLYAVTATEVSGGTTRYLSLISQDDITAAQKQLQAEALKQVRDKLQSRGQVLADQAFNLNVTQFTTDNPVGTQTPSFTATFTAQLSGLAFKSDDLNSLISQRISQTLASNKTLEQRSGDQTTYTARNLDLNNQLAVLEVHYQGQAVFNIDLAGIAPELVGKSQSDVNEILRSKAEIDKVEITLAPAWQKNFPMFASKIKVTIGNPDANNQALDLN